MPATGHKIWEQLSITKDIAAASLGEEVQWGGLRPGTRISKGPALFPRIETAKNQ
jgi:methionyl-tRNA synthetase